MKNTSTVLTAKREFVFKSRRNCSGPSTVADTTSQTMNSKLWDQQKQRHECRRCCEERVVQSMLMRSDRRWRRPATSEVGTQWSARYVDTWFRRSVATVQARRFSLFGYNARIARWNRCQKILTASPWRTGGDHRDALVLRGWRLSNRIWNSINFRWMKQLTWLRIVHSGDWCLRLALLTPTGACRKRRKKIAKVSACLMLLFTCRRYLQSCKQLYCRVL